MSDADEARLAILREVDALLRVRCWDRHGGAYPNCEDCWRCAPLSMAAVSGESAVASSSGNDD